MLRSAVPAAAFTAADPASLGASLSLGDTRCSHPPLGPDTTGEAPAIAVTSSLSVVASKLNEMCTCVYMTV